MSSSFKMTPSTASLAEVQPFSYAEIEANDIHLDQPIGLDSSSSRDLLSDANSQWAQREAAAMVAGRQAGEAEARAGFEAQLNMIRGTVAQALRDFAEQRSTYFRQVEAEVVQLALSIARKILHREAQVDRLLLAALVRVSLEQIAAGTAVNVRVNPQQLGECQEYFAQHMNETQIPTVTGDPQIALDGCVLETSLGRTELGIEVQLKEVERGLADLMDKTPREVQ